MRCKYVEIACPVDGPFTCFKCEQCGKKINLATAIKDRINEITRQFPDCDDPSKAPPAPLVHGPSSQPAPAPFTPPPAPPMPPQVWDPAGAGTQLKKMLAKVGITSTENCSCNARARLMNERGIEWCEQNVPEIVSWLKEEAGRRNLPFLSLPAKIIIQRAIRVAKKIRDKQVVDATAVEAVTPEDNSADEPTAAVVDEIVSSSAAE